METKTEISSLWKSMTLAWHFAGQSSRFGRTFILGEVVFAGSAIIYSILARGGAVPSYWIPLSGFYLLYVALGELQLELWIKQQEIIKRDAIIVGYKAISRCAMIVVFCAAIIMIK